MKTEENVRERRTGFEGISTAQNNRKSENAQESPVSRNAVHMGFPKRRAEPA